MNSIQLLGFIKVLYFFWHIKIYTHTLSIYYQIPPFPFYIYKYAGPIAFSLFSYIFMPSYLKRSFSPKTKNKNLREIIEIYLMNVKLGRLDFSGENIVCCCWNIYSISHKNQIYSNQQKKYWRMERIIYVLTRIWICLRCQGI